DSWNMDFGIKYPRFLSSGVTPGEGNYGIFFSFQRNFTEHIGLRLDGNYLHLDATGQKTNMLALNYDLLYNILPCESASPFVTFGLGNILYKFDKSSNDLKSKFYLDYQLNLGAGMLWRLGDNTNLLTELDYYTAATSKLDGVSGPGNGLLGGIGDTYMAFKIGFQYFFSKGEPSKLCDNLYGGLAEENKVDYDRIESIIRKYASKPGEGVDYDRIENIVKKNQPEVNLKAAQPMGNWVLIGVNFAPNSAKFKTEAYPILYHAAQIMVQNPELKVEIQGYSDNTGPDMFNLTLSLQRANAVKDYLIARGVAADRLTAVGYGSKNPVADNRTADGRVLNRRIEFKVLK
ncbi:MAG: OmpA family protein, partial [Syntrophothermus sp.]